MLLMETAMRQVICIQNMLLPFSFFLFSSLYSSLPPPSLCRPDKPPPRHICHRATVLANRDTPPSAASSTTTRKKWREGEEKRQKKIERERNKGTVKEESNG